MTDIDSELKKPTDVVTLQKEVSSVAKVNDTTQVVPGLPNPQNTGSVNLWSINLFSSMLKADLFHSFAFLIMLILLMSTFFAGLLTIPEENCCGDEDLTFAGLDEIPFDI